MLTVSQLYIYPIKSLGGISQNTSPLSDRGFVHDRRWMLVDDQNIFMSQRAYPAMALLQVFLQNDGLLVQHKKSREKLVVPYKPSGEMLSVKIWNDVCEAAEVSPQVSEWFSNILAVKCKLVYMPDSTRRRVDSHYASNNEITGFTDDFPFLLISQSSLDKLNERLETPVPMNRFRPNIVVAGSAPFEEDEWAHFTINNVNFYGAKLCGRCIVTTIDQQEGIQGKEPLRTLSTFRSSGNKTFFGQYLVHHGAGEINIGDTIAVHERKKPLLPQ